MRELGAASGRSLGLVVAQEPLELDLLLLVENIQNLQPAALVKSLALLFEAHKILRVVVQDQLDRLPLIGVQVQVTLQLLHRYTAALISKGRPLNGRKEAVQVKVHTHRAKSCAT